MTDLGHILKVQPTGFPCFTLFTTSDFQRIKKLAFKTVKNKIIKALEGNTVKGKTTF